MVRKPDRIFLHVFVSLCTMFNGNPIILNLLTNRNIRLIYSVTICEQKTEDCTWSGSFQNKLQHCCFHLWCLPAVLTSLLYLLWWDGCWERGEGGYWYITFSWCRWELTLQGYAGEMKGSGSYCNIYTSLPSSCTHSWCRWWRGHISQTDVGLVACHALLNACRSDCITSSTFNFIQIWHFCYC